MKSILVLIALFVNSFAFAGTTPEEAKALFAREFNIQTPDDAVTDLYTFNIDKDLKASLPQVAPMNGFSSITASLNTDTGVYCCGANSLPILEVSISYGDEYETVTTVFRFTIVEDEGTGKVVSLIDVIEVTNLRAEEKSSYRFFKNNKLL